MRDVISLSADYICLSIILEAHLPYFSLDIWLQAAHFLQYNELDLLKVDYTNFGEF